MFDHGRRRWIDLGSDEVSDFDYGGNDPRSELGVNDLAGGNSLDQCFGAERDMVNGAVDFSEFFPVVEPEDERSGD